MEIIDCIRRPFDVKAVEITLANVHEVAEWCKGTVGEAKVKMMGAEAMLPCVELPGQGTKKGQKFVAQLGHFIVEHKGSFRVYRPQQFQETFVERQKPTRDPLHTHDCVEVVNEQSDFNGWQGVVEEVQQTIVDFGARGVYRFGEDELKRIRTLSQDQAEKMIGPNDVIAGDGTGKPLPEVEQVFNGAGELIRDVLRENYQQHQEGCLVEQSFEKDNWVRVINPASEQYKWTGFVMESDEDLVRVRFDNEGVEYSYLHAELEKFAKVTKA